MSFRRLYTLLKYIIWRPKPVVNYWIYYSNYLVSNKNYTQSHDNSQYKFNKKKTNPKLFLFIVTIYPFDLTRSRNLTVYFISKYCAHISSFYNYCAIIISNVPLLNWFLYTLSGLLKLKYYFHLGFFFSSNECIGLTMMCTFLFLYPKTYSDHQLQE